MRTSWRMIRGHRDLRYVLSAGLISALGDWVLRIGLVYRVYAITGSTLASALTMMSSFVPQVVLGPVAGVFADRWDRKRTMIVTDLLLAAGLLPLLSVRGPAQVPVVFAVLLWEGAVQQFFSPAEQALVPRLVPDDQLLAANALNGQVSDVSRLAGSGLGGVLAALGGISAVALTDAATFAASAGLLVLISASGATEREPATARQLAVIVTDLRDGLRLAVRHPVLRALVCWMLITSAGEGIMGTLMAPFVRQVLHGTSQAYGLVLAAQAIGGIAGGVIAVPLSQRATASRLFSYSSIAFGLIDLAVFLYPLGYQAIWPAVAGMIITGLPAALCLAGLLTLFQRGTQDSYRGRIFGALNAVQGLAVLAGTLAAGYLTRPLGIIPVLAVQGAGYLLAGTAMTYWLRGTPDPDNEQTAAPLLPPSTTPTN